MHRPNRGILEEKPIIDFDGFGRALGVGDAMVIVVRLNQILHDAPRFEKPNPAAVGVDVCQGWDVTVGVESQELGFPVSVLGGVDFVNAVGQSVTESEQGVRKRKV